MAYYNVDGGIAYVNMYVLIFVLTHSLSPQNRRYFDLKAVLSPEPFFLAQICTKSFSGWGFTHSRSQWGAHSAPLTV